MLNVLNVPRQENTIKQENHNTCHSWTLVPWVYSRMSDVMSYAVSPQTDGVLFISLQG